MSRTRRKTHEKILDAAMTLLAVEGVRSTTVDRIAQTAGITKRTLYHYFRSKDDLLAECLAQVSAKERIQVLRLKEQSPDITGLVGTLFSNVAESARDPRWKGCAFARAAFELAGFPGHPVVRAARDHKSKIETLLISCLRSAGVIDAERWGRRLILLYDGAISQSVLHHDPNWAAEAGRLALHLLQQALAQVQAEQATLPSCSRHPPFLIELAPGATGEGIGPALA